LYSFVLGRISAAIADVLTTRKSPMTARFIIWISSVAPISLL
jgi:hypothetical protein